MNRTVLRARLKDAAAAARARIGESPWPFDSHVSLSIDLVDSSRQPVTWLALSKDEIDLIVKSLLAHARDDSTLTGNKARALAAQLRSNGSGSNNMSPDEQEALSRRYGNDVIMVLPLSSGRVAVFGNDRQLRGYCSGEDLREVLRVWSGRAEVPSRRPLLRRR